MRARERGQILEWGGVEGANDAACATDENHRWRNANTEKLSLVKGEKGGRENEGEWYEEVWKGGDRGNNESLLKTANKRVKGREIKDEAKTVDKLEDEPAHGKGVRVVVKWWDEELHS